MKDPIDIVKGKIVSINDKGCVTIECNYSDYNTFIKRGYKDCLVQMIDSRCMSDKQRKSCYAMIREISDYTGMTMSSTKEFAKLKFMADELGQTANIIFSLSNAPMSLVSAFQRFLARFILDNDIPCSRRLITMVDDIGDYMYACMANKKCCVCGKPADLHHIDRVGMGNDREEIVHLGMRAVTLCREHHTEAHTMPDKEFFDKYHLNSEGIVLDSSLCKIFGLKTKREKTNVK